MTTTKIMACGSHNLRSGVALREARWPAAALVRARRAMAIPAMDSNKDADISTKDWRAQQMTDAVRALFERVWSKGEVALIDTLVSEDFVWKDAIWASTRPVVGRKAFCAFVGQMRQAYPDLAYTVEQVGVCDPVHVFVRWEMHGTNLAPSVDGAGKPHKPTFHESIISGIDFCTFNADRSLLQEIVIFRQPTLEEREFLEEEALNQDRLAIRLERLV